MWERESLIPGLVDVLKSISCVGKKEIRKNGTKTARAERVSTINIQKNAHICTFLYIYYISYAKKCTV